MRRGLDNKLWDNSFSNELGRLTNGVGSRIKTGRQTTKFRKRSIVPHNKKVTYGQIVAPLRPYKEENQCMQLTVGGNILDYDGYESTPTPYLTTTKVFINRIISTNKARMATTDIENFYLNNYLPESE